MLYHHLSSNWKSIKNSNLSLEFANGGSFHTAVTSKNSTPTISQEMLSDDGNVLTPTPIITEPYFDTQTLKNVTGLVGKSQK